MISNAINQNPLSPGKLPNLLVISAPMPLHNKATQVSLTNFIELLQSVSNAVFINAENFQLDSNALIDVNFKSLVYNTMGYGIIRKALSNGRMQLRKSIEIVKLFRSQKIDLVIFFIGGSLLFPIIVAKLCRKKIIIVATGSPSKSAAAQPGLLGIVFSKTFKVVEAIGFSLANYISVESKSVMKFMNLDKYKSKIVSNFGTRYVDIEHFVVSQPISNREYSVGFVGRMSPEKGILNFISALPKLMAKDKNAKFLIVGDGPLSKEVTKKIRTLNDNERVAVKKWVNHEDLVMIYNDMKILLVPSFTEGLPGVVQEAMACGTIVIGTKVGGIPDLIYDGKTGFLLDSNDPYVISEKVTSVLEQQNLQEIAANGRRLISDEYSYSSLVNKYRQILQQIARTD
jgi:glycosyltransferase involved in cell wall biosynthesis